MSTHHGLVGLAGLVMTSAVLAQTPTPTPALPASFFPFVIPWDDATPGTATDVSFLNHTPAGKFGRVVVRGAKLVFEQTGEEVRFFGTNFGANEAFPTRQRAAKFARRLAKLGVNIVRLHHLDNPWAIGSGGSIFDPRLPTRQQFDPALLDRLDGLIAELRANGIYYNMNLKVSKTLEPADGFPESLRQIPFAFQKRVDKFDRRMIELQKDYARRLLDHVNPYTGLRYADDPGMVVVELNNENSLLGDPWGTLGLELDKLPQPFLGDLQTLWNHWLTRRYADDAALHAAWGVGDGNLGPDLIPVATGWSSEAHSGSTTQISTSPSGTPSRLPKVHATIVNPTTTDWHNQVKVSGLSLSNGQPYVLRCRVRADQARRASVTFQLEAPPWSIVGLGRQLDLTPSWQDVQLAFTARDAQPNLVKLAFLVGGSVIPVEIEGVQLFAGMPPVVLEPGERLSARTIRVPADPTGTQRTDWLNFLAETERAYVNEMRQFLTTELGVQAIIYDSQIAWGGTTAYHREADSPMLDAHAYWHHPSFPGAAWDPNNWTIANQPMVPAMGTGDELTNLALWRRIDRPYSVSEYDHPAPSDFAADTVPLLASFAAAQGWNALYTFAISPYGDAVANRIQGFFDHTSHPGKVAFYPAAALMFRRGAVPPLPDVVTAAIPHDLRNAQGHVSTAWAGVANIRQRALTAQIGLGGALPTSQPTTQAATAASIRLEGSSNSAAYVIDAPSAIGAVGYIGGTTRTIGPARINVASFGNNFAALTLTAIDGRAIEHSGRALLTVVGRAENVNMGWNANRTSVGNRWGSGPVHVEGVALNIRLRGPDRQVWALNPDGTRRARLASTHDGQDLTFSISPADATIWFELLADTTSPVLQRPASRKRHTP